MGTGFFKRVWERAFGGTKSSAVGPVIADVTKPKRESRPRKKAVKRSDRKKAAPVKPIPPTEPLIRPMELWSAVPGKCRPLPDGWAPPDGSEYIDGVPILSLIYSSPGGDKPMSCYDIEPLFIEACFGGQQWQMDLRGRFTFRDRLIYKNMGYERHLTEDLNACLTKFLSRLPRGSGKDLRGAHCFAGGFRKPHIIPAPAFRRHYLDPSEVVRVSDETLHERRMSGPVMAAPQIP